MGKKYIYAFDLSLSSTGLTIFDELGQPVLITSVQTNEKEHFSKRLKQIAEFILDLRDKYSPKLIILERAFSRFNVATAALYRVHGVVNLLFSDVDQFYYTPKDIKATILRGNSTKIQIQEKLKLKYPEIVFANNDESDSFSVGLTYFIKNGLLEKW